MYNVLKLTDNISLLTTEMDNNIVSKIKEKMISKYECNILPNINSYVLKIIDINTSSIKNGKINDINGNISYNVEYTAVVFDPQKGRVIDVYVDKCDELGIWGHPIHCPIKDTVVECICVAGSLGPYKYHDGSYVSKTIISPGSSIKFKILNKQIENEYMGIIGTLVN